MEKKLGMEKSRMEKMKAQMEKKLKKSFWKLLLQFYFKLKSKFKAMNKIVRN